MFYRAQLAPKYLVESRFGSRLGHALNLEAYLGKDARLGKEVLLRLNDVAERVEAVTEEFCQVERVSLLVRWVIVLDFECPVDCDADGKGRGERSG